MPNRDETIPEKRLFDQLTLSLLNLELNKIFNELFRLRFYNIELSLNRKWNKFKLGLGLPLSFLL